LLLYIHLDYLTIANRKNPIVFSRLDIAESGEFTEGREDGEAAGDDEARQVLALSRGSIEANTGVNMARDDIRFGPRGRVMRKHERRDDEWSVDAVDARLDGRISCMPIVIPSHERDVDCRMRVAPLCE
jgi:hypothetical protein